jgi:hypothetical protein
MGDTERNEVMLNEYNSSHLAELLGNMVSELSYIFSMNLANDKELRKERQEIFFKFKHDYEVANRSRLFFGSASTRQILNESINFALRQTQKVSREINSTGDEQINRFIKLAGEAPNQFLEAIVSVFQGVQSGRNPQLVSGNNKVSDMIDILTKFERRGNNDKKPVKEKRKNFNRAFEENP